MGRNNQMTYLESILLDCKTANKKNKQKCGDLNYGFYMSCFGGGGVADLAQCGIVLFPGISAYASCMSFPKMP